MFKDMSKYRTDPLGMTRVVFDRLREVSDGDHELVDPNNPMTYLIDSSCFSSAVQIQEGITLLRQLYPDLSQVREDLYRHLSDQDMFDLFSQPATKVFNLFMSVGEIEQRAVVDPATGIKKIVLPRHTQVNIVDYYFTLQYPIEIRILNHGGLQIVYNNEITSPLQPLESNVLDFDIVMIKGYDGKFLQLNIPMQQLQLTSKRFSIDTSSGVVKELPYTDQYCMTRAWLSTDSGWTEVPVIHQDVVYDRSGLAVYAVVKEDSVGYTIPAPLITDNIIGRTLRIDLYTSKGQISHNIDNYQSDQFVVEWVNRDDSDMLFTAPLEAFTMMQLTAVGVIEGGRDALTFEEIKELTNNNALGNKGIPITHHQLEVLCDRRGYRLSMFVDNLTDRILLASKGLPVLSGSELSTGASMTSQQIILDMKTLKNRDDVYHHGNSVLLTPDVLFEQIRGATKILPIVDGDNLRNASSEVIASHINSRNLLYSPFYYLLDYNNDRFDTRVYDLDNPTVIRKLFVQENEASLLQINTESYLIRKTVLGYRLTTVARPGEGMKDLSPSSVVAQLRTTPIGETQPAYLNGRFIREVENGWMFEFDIELTHYIDRNDAVAISNFKMFDDANRILPVGMTLDFNLVYYVERYYADNAPTSSMDSVLATWLVNDTYVGVNEELFTIKLGERLRWLWVGGRTVPGIARYEHHTTNKVMLHPVDVYEENEDGSKKLIELPDGRFDLNLLHAKGSPVMINGEPVYEHRVGDLKVVDGEPVVVADRELEFMVNIVLVEAGFYFATSEESLDYKNTIANILTQWVTEDLIEFNRRLLTGTEMFFFPQNTAGMVDVVVEDNRHTSIEASQSPHVRYYLNRVGYENTQLRLDLERHARQVIARHLTRRNITKTAILADLSTSLSSDVLDIEVNGLGGSNNFNTITLVDPQNSCTLRKRLDVLPNGETVVRDQLDVEFILHRDI